MSKIISWHFWYLRETLVLLLFQPQRGLLLSYLYLQGNLEFSLNFILCPKKSFFLVFHKAYVSTGSSPISSQCLSPRGLVRVSEPVLPTQQTGYFGAQRHHSVGSGLQLKMWRPVCLVSLGRKRFHWYLVFPKLTESAKFLSCIYCHHFSFFPFGSCSGG